MHVVDDPVNSEKSSKAIEHMHSDARPHEERLGIDAAISLLSNIVETACEREPDLDLLRLVKYMDLYRVYLQLASDIGSDLQKYMTQISGPSEFVLTQRLGETELVSFERFVRDSHLLTIAASAASMDSVEKVDAPLPLNVSAND